MNARHFHAALERNNTKDTYRSLFSGKAIHELRQTASHVCPQWGKLRSSQLRRRLVRLLNQAEKQAHQLPQPSTTGATDKLLQKMRKLMPNGHAEISTTVSKSCAPSTCSASVSSTGLRGEIPGTKTAIANSMGQARKKRKPSRPGDEAFVSHGVTR